MNKSNLKFRDIDEYHALFPDDIQKILELLRQIIKQAAPQTIETISYGMPAFKQNKVLVYYAVHKEHIGFYPTSNPIVHFKKELEKYHTSKGAIQFPIDKALPLTLIKKIVKFRIEEDTIKANKTGEILKGVLHDVPSDMQKTLTSNADILEKWNKLTPIQRNEWICWVTIVKKSEKRAEHLDRMVEELKEGKRQPCCWPGCPHRNPNAKKWFK
ncbi:MAG: DUF1801 domain-containing protein [Bacteroidetes bacterium]|nr:DUF1801 domain-containing protein [Bacteroidota bacterium]